MRQLLYVSDSSIGTDIAALDKLLVQAKTNNALDGITGLLWTDGRQFAQIVEGGTGAIEALLKRLQSDGRHENLRVVLDEEVRENQFGDWSMTRPATDKLAQHVEQKALRKLSTIDTELSRAFMHVIGGSGAPAVD